MKLTRHTISNIFLLLVIFMMVRIPFTKAWLFDDEFVSDNTFITSTLDATLEPVSDDFDGNTLLFGEFGVRNYRYENVGTLPFIYSLTVNNPVDEDTGFCGLLEAKLFMGSTEIYSGLLKDLEVNSLLTDQAYNLQPGEFVDLELKIYVPDEANPVLSGNSCTFDLDTLAESYGFGSMDAYWDTEGLTNTVEAASWFIEQRFESMETIAADEENESPLGYCNITTNDKSMSDGTEAYQQVNWTPIEGAVVYKVYEYIEDEDTWNLNDTFEIPADSDDLTITEDKVSWERSVPKGVYAYYIEALNSEDKVIGKTIPDNAPFTCTFTVQWVEEGGIVINEIMWPGSTEWEQDEWVELRNMTDEDIDLTGWKLKGGAESDHDIILDGVIPADGYFLISKLPTDFDDKARGKDVKAAILNAIEEDQVADDMDLAENGEQLTLLDTTENEIDKTPAIPQNNSDGDKGWAYGEREEGDDEYFRSMERDSDPGDGTDEDNWHTCLDDMCNDGTYWDHNGGENYGTPKHENSPEVEEEVEGASLQMLSAPQFVIVDTIEGVDEPITPEDRKDPEPVPEIEPDPALVDSPEPSIVTESEPEPEPQPEEESNETAGEPEVTE